VVLPETVRPRKRRIHSETPKIVLDFFCSYTFLDLELVIDRPSDFGDVKKDASTYFAIGDCPDRFQFQKPAQ
jgi:hypothetical protein